METPKDFLIQATEIAKVRAAVRRERKPEHRGTGDPAPWKYDLIGAIGEAYVAVLLGTYPEWVERNLKWVQAEEDYGRSDGPDYQVRSSGYPGAHLPIHKGERYPELPSILVIVGWEGRSAWIPGYAPRQATFMVERYWREDIPYPAYWVPQMDLRPFSEFLERRSNA